MILMKQYKKNKKIKNGEKIKKKGNTGKRKELKNEKKN